MESSAAVHGEVRAPQGRMLMMLVGAVVLLFAIAFAIGTATKTTASTPSSGALAPAITLNAPNASVTALQAGVAVPGLRTASSKPKQTSHAAASTASKSSPAVTPAAPAASAPVVAPVAPVTPVTPAQPTRPTQPTSHSGGSGSGTGVSHGGG